MYACLIAINDSLSVLMSIKIISESDPYIINTNFST